MRSDGTRIATHRRQRVWPARLARQRTERDAERVPMVEWRRIIPAFAERVRDVADGGPPYQQLDVVPGRSIAVPFVELDRLRIALVA